MALIALEAEVPAHACSFHAADLVRAKARGVVRNDGFS